MRGGSSNTGTVEPKKVKDYVWFRIEVGTRKRDLDKGDGSFKNETARHNERGSE